MNSKENSDSTKKDKPEIDNKTKFINKNKLCLRVSPKFKIILIGDSNVGKTAIINRFINNIFSKDHHCTIGVEFFVKSVIVGEDKVDLQIWDTCGQERYKTITKQYYREINGYILIFDLSNKNSFSNIKHWLNDISEYGQNINCKIIVGNKNDLSEERQVGQEEIDNFILENNIEYIELSAKSGYNIEKCFENITSIILKNKENNQKKFNDITDSFFLNKQTKPKKCCNIF